MKARSSMGRNFIEGQQRHNNTPHDTQSPRTHMQRTCTCTRANGGTRSGEVSRREAIVSLTVAAPWLGMFLLIFLPAVCKVSCATHTQTKCVRGASEPNPLQRDRGRSFSSLLCLGVLF